MRITKHTHLNFRSNNMQNEQQKKDFWNRVITPLQTFIDDAQLDPIQADELKSIVLYIAKTEYMLGSKAGISFAFKKAQENQNKKDIENLQNQS
jgi:hypothetical protein